jgi:hypothetical protein
VVGQDNLRRIVLRERDIPGGANIGLIDIVARYALDHGFHVVMDGILYARHYGEMLEALRHDHRGVCKMYYLDVPFEETMYRHATRPQANEFGRAEMQAWYRERDLLPGGVEQVIPASCSLESAVLQIMRESGLAPGPAGADQTNCPALAVTSISQSELGQARNWVCAAPQNGQAQAQQLRDHRLS